MHTLIIINIVSIIVCKGPFSFMYMCKNPQSEICRVDLEKKTLHEEDLMVKRCKLSLYTYSIITGWALCVI